MEGLSKGAISSELFQTFPFYKNGMVFPNRTDLIKFDQLMNHFTSDGNTSGS